MPHIPWRFGGGPPEKPKGPAGKTPTGNADKQPTPTRPPKRGQVQGPGPHEKGRKPPKP